MSYYDERARQVISGGTPTGETVRNPDLERVIGQQTNDATTDDQSTNVEAEDSSTSARIRRGMAQQEADQTERSDD